MEAESGVNRTQQMSPSILQDDVRAIPSKTTVVGENSRKFTADPIELSRNLYFRGGFCKHGDTIRYSNFADAQARGLWSGKSENEVLLSRAISGKMPIVSIVNANVDVAKQASEKGLLAHYFVDEWGQEVVYASKFRNSTLFDVMQVRNRIVVTLYTHISLVN